MGLERCSVCYRGCLHHLGKIAIFGNKESQEVRELLQSVRAHASPFAALAVVEQDDPLIARLPFLQERGQVGRSTNRLYLRRRRVQVARDDGLKRCERSSSGKLNVCLHLPKDLEEVLRQLELRLRDFYGERYAGLVLFGSYARGDWTEHSDVDLLLLLEGEVSSSREIMRAEDVVYPFALESGHLLTLVPVSIDTFYSSGEPLLINVRKEGINVSAR